MESRERKQLADDVCRESPEAWAAFVDLTLGAATAAARKTLTMYGGKPPTEEELEAVVYSVYAALVQSGYGLLKRLGPPHDLRSLLAIAARQRALEILRAKEQAIRTMNLQVAKGLSLLPTEPPDDPKITAIESALANMPGRDAMLIRSIYVGGRSYREGASLVGVPLSGVGPGLARALRFIRDRLIARREVSP